MCPERCSEGGAGENSACHQRLWRGPGPGWAAAASPARGGCGGAVRRGGVGRPARLQAPPAAAQRMTGGYPAAAALPAQRGAGGPPPLSAAPGQTRGPAAPHCTALHRTAPHRTGPAQRSPAQPSSPLPQAARLLRLLPPAPVPVPVPCGGSRLLPRYSPRRAPPAPQPRPPTAPSPRRQANPRRCSAPLELLQAPVSTCARLRAAGRASSASPLPAAPGLILCRSVAPAAGLLSRGQVVCCTALSPFPAISNLHALSFLRYRLILVWRRRLAILSQAHSCG
ncbi:sterile alpha motif domain-containing protein 1-like [Lathamus discolor]|uniref:sterile alpha motif domain-containing protein 1-like n=1 Tax=Lathamus discolor TaxID=678569 RepID=UPI0032B86B3B